MSLQSLLHGIGFLVLCWGVTFAVVVMTGRGDHHGLIDGRLCIKARYKFRITNLQGGFAKQLP